MKIWSRLVATIYILAGLILCLGILFLWANENLLDTYQKFFTGHLFRLGLASMVVLLLGITWLVNWIEIFYRNKAITFDNPGGKVKISLKAVEEFINSRILGQIPGVKSLVVRAGLSSRGLETSINLKLMAGANIPETCAHIQEMTKNYLQDVVGVERVASIEVFVSSIITKEDTTVQSAVSPEERNESESSG